MRKSEFYGSTKSLLGTPYLSNTAQNFVSLQRLSMVHYQQQTNHLTINKSRQQ